MTQADKVPYWLRRIVGRCHVADSNLDVIRYVRSRMSPDWRHNPNKKAERKRIYRLALQAHRENFDLYAAVMRGGY